jgi:hypothetical protein
MRAARLACVYALADRQEELVLRQARGVGDGEDVATRGSHAGDGGHQLVPVLEGAEGRALDVREGRRVDDQEVEHAAALAELLEVR